MASSHQSIYSALEQTVQAILEEIDAEILEELRRMRDSLEHSSACNSEIMFYEKYNWEKEGF